MGKAPSISTPTPPPAPTVADTTKAYVDSLPAMYQASLDWNPKLTQQEFDLTSQYAGKYKDLQTSLYPELAKLDSQLTSQATTGSATSQLSPEQQKMYVDQYRSEVGDQQGSGIGADYVSRGVLGQGMQQQQFYQNMALALTGRQSLYQVQQTPTTNIQNGYNYGSVAGQMQQGYGNYSQLYGSMYGNNAQNTMNNANNTLKYTQMGVNAGFKAASMFAA